MSLNLPKNSTDFVEYQRKIVNNLGYFALSRYRIGRRETTTENFSGNQHQTAHKKEYYVESTFPIAQGIFWFSYINTGIKALFLVFLVSHYFGPVEFLDKIAALDYILCVGIVILASCIWFLKYPLYEILHGFWKTENTIFRSLGSPKDLRTILDKRHRATVWIHLFIVWLGCFILVTQFFADPKYCTWTYSAFQVDNLYLRIIFVIHEFFFMMHAWNSMTCSSSLCTFQGIALSNIINRMTQVLEQETNKSISKSFPGSNKLLHNYASVEQLIFDYKQLMLISELFNSWVSYKIVFLHACGYCQFISNVFVGLQILKMPGTGIWNVWFYIEDSFASMYMIYRVYKFMSRVEPSSVQFLNSLQSYISTDIHQRRRTHLRKLSRTLRIVSLKLGPCPVTPYTVVKALEMLGNYYVCVALWK